MPDPTYAGALPLRSGTLVQRGGGAVAQRTAGMDPQDCCCCDLSDGTVYGPQAASYTYGITYTPGTIATGTRHVDTYDGTPDSGGNHYARDVTVAGSWAGGNYCLAHTYDVGTEDEFGFNREGQWTFNLPSPVTVTITGTGGAVLAVLDTLTIRLTAVQSGPSVPTDYIVIEATLTHSAAPAAGAVLGDLETFYLDASVDIHAEWQPDTGATLADIPSSLAAGDVTTAPYNVTGYGGTFTLRCGCFFPAA